MLISPLYIKNGAVPGGTAPCALIARLGQGRIGCQFADDCDPGSLTGLPSALVLAAHIGPVDQLIAVCRRAADRHG